MIPVRGWAQLPPVGVPAGVVRLELDGSIETFDRRFRDGDLEPYAADLSTPGLGSDRIPLLLDADTRIGRIIGNPSYRINLGGLSTDSHGDVGTGFLGLSLGLTSRITIFGRIPLVRTRVQSRMELNPASADAGLNPGADQLAFFDQFDLALTTLNNKLAAGDYDGNPTQRALAQATLTDGTALRADLFGLLADATTASPALPIAASAAGTAINARVTTLQNTLATNLDVPGFTLTPELPEAPVSEADLVQMLSSPSGPHQLRLDESRVTFRGDAEVGAALTLVDRWDQGTHRGGLRTAVSGLVRLPTGRREQTDRPLSIGTGDGQTDLQVDLVTDVGTGQFGARLTGMYLRQLPANIVERVTHPSQPFAGPDRLALVRWNPGDVISVGVRPFYRLARTLAFQAGLEHWTRSTDRYSYLSSADALPGIDPNVLGSESKANATLFSVGITYANPAGLRPGGRGLPVDASWAYERVLRAGGGRVPNTHRVAARFRAYFGVW
jgi:hypothetical protein